MAVSAKNIPAPDLVTVRRALLSVSDKTGLVPFATLLDGLGMEPHEEPWIRGDNQATLEAGMTFTVEPGVYLPEFGVRSEINVYVDKDGGVHVTGGALQTEIRRILL